ncbi:hypothetical protein ACX93W_12725 [Paenibacillus sp. CAU 1782]
MLKGIAWLGKLVAGGLILSFLCIWTTGYIVTSYVESILKQYELPLEVPPMAVSGVWGKLWGSEPLLAGNDGETEAVGDTGLANGKDPLEEGKESGAQDPESTGMPNAAEVIGEMDQEDPVKAGSDIGHSSEDPSIEGAETAVTTDEMLDVKDEMSQADKDQIFSLLMLKLPQEALQNISFLMEEGLTEGELIQIQQLLAQYLEPEEYDSMMEILKKY